MAFPLHPRFSWRLAIVVTGLVLASGRRTAASLLRVARIAKGLRSSYYFLDAVGCMADDIALVLLRRIAREVLDSKLLLISVDDTPTKR